MITFTIGYLTIIVPSLAFAWIVSWRDVNKRRCECTEYVARMENQDPKSSKVGF